MNSPGFVKLNQNKAKKLAGVDWVIDGVRFRFKPRDPNRGGHQPWTTGTEAIAYPLLNTENKVVAYLKGFKKPTQRRFDRTYLLAELNLSTVAATLLAAPTRWLDTRFDGRPKAKEIDFDFCGSLMPAVPGKTWIEIKKDICARRVKLSPEFRLRCIKDLLLSLAILEQINFIHGDLSPNNIIINTDADPDKPALYLIDFDAFVYEFPSGEISFVPQSEGGTFGTPGYFPPELELKDDQDPTKHPFSDRFGRDMLIMELLVSGTMTDDEKPVREWDHTKVKRRLLATIKKYETSTNISQLVERLMSDDIFCCSEDARPTSEAIASQIKLEHLIPVVPSTPSTEPAPPKSPVQQPAFGGKKERASRERDGGRRASVPVPAKSDSSSTPKPVTLRSRQLALLFITVIVLLFAALPFITQRKGRLAKIDQDAAKQTEQERMDAVKAKKERIAAEKLEQERMAAVKLEQERIAAEKLEQERIAAEKLEQERMAAEEAEEERKAAGQTEEERKAAAKAEEERKAAAKAEKERMAVEKKEYDRYIFLRDKYRQTRKIYVDKNMLDSWGELKKTYGYIEYKQLEEKYHGNPEYENW